MTTTSLQEKIWPIRGQRAQLGSDLADLLADAIDDVHQGAVRPSLTLAEIREALVPFTFEKPQDLREISEIVVTLLKRGTVHTMHPCYFGLFNPSVVFPGIIADQILDMARHLKSLLLENGWRVVNQSPCAVVCFVDDKDAADPAAVAKSVIEEGLAWISAAQFEGRPVIRACITSHFTNASHLNVLIGALDRARRVNKAIS